MFRHLRRDWLDAELRRQLGDDVVEPAALRVGPNVAFAEDVSEPHATTDEGVLWRGQQLCVHHRHKLGVRLVVQHTVHGRERIRPERDNAGGVGNERSERDNGDDDADKLEDGNRNLVVAFDVSRRERDAKRKAVAVSADAGARGAVLSRISRDDELGARRGVAQENVARDHRGGMDSRALSQTFDPRFEADRRNVCELDRSGRAAVHGPLERPVQSQHGAARTACPRKKVLKHAEQLFVVSDHEGDDSVVEVSQRLECAHVLTRGDARDGEAGHVR